VAGRDSGVEEVQTEAIGETTGKARPDTGTDVKGEDISRGD
jgi:hypothetical protein